MKKKSKVPSLVTIIILTAITLIFWVVFSIVRAFTTKPSPAVSEDILQGLDPTLDTSSLSEILNRTFLSEGEIGQTNLSATPSANIVTAPEPTASPTASASASPTATPSATATASALLAP